ncbi:ComF family protein [Clostridium tertium]|jgi:competence protein ComFC|uniref:ComF family protein n=1 Tax=Clostridium TaxID=1485 RepID=UPI001159DF4B|nr:MULTISPECIES: ComF family protein [Clostridium]MBS5307278.1 ComF family protein [Clostridium sp.]MDB1921558.1 ComF family protein [Clostridium tertium]MDB1924802.1 ComF family protein [Clostridium tertium]MDB1928330.1 ComF family protein [Clostridium tertium]MDB1934730.1 ComF family protein [Clostridium tertium]
MGKGLIKLLREIIDELLDIIYPPKNKCITCDNEVIGVCPICKSKIMRVKEESKILSYGYYSGVMKKLILEFKYNKNFLAGNILADYLCELINENNIDVDAILFIPSSKKALKDRGFNQCEFMAQKLSRTLNIPIYSDIIKVKNIKEQKTLSKEDRFKNIEGAFGIKSNKNIKNKNIILIDDVITTGATLLECEKLLKKSGANSIKILTVAKSYI